MIYIHIPFCDSKCYYCNFNSGVFNDDVKEKYFKSLEDEIIASSQKFKQKTVCSVYIGGGTPSSVNETYILRIINTVKNNYNVSEDAEISIEANPCSVSKEKLATYKQCGVNRISFGVQSLSNKLLKLIGRKHNKQTAINAIKTAKSVGFDNINADLLIGIPKQSYKALKASVKTLIKQGVTHISAYMLINEHGTKLTNMINSGLKTVSEDKCVKFYNKLVKFLENKGFNRYEISNFAMPNNQCQHNIGYWDMKEYVGFGLSAHSFYCDSRFENNSDIKDYIKNNWTISKETLTPSEIIEETIMLGLRQAKGVNISKLNKLGFDVLKQKQNEIEYLKTNGFIEVENDHIKVNKNSFGVTNQIILKLIP